MAIVQTITFNSDKNYYMGFLQNILNLSDVAGYVTRRGKKIEMVIEQSDEEALERFSQNVEKMLPHSIFLDTFRTDISETLEPKEEFFIHELGHGLCPRCLHEELYNPESQNYKNAAYRCDHYLQKPLKQKGFEKDMEQLATSLGEEPEIIEGEEYATEYFDDAFLLLLDPLRALELFLLSEEEKKALFSFEKPLLKVAIKDEVLQERVGRKYIKVKVYDNAFDAVLAHTVKERLPFLFKRAKKKGTEAFINKERLYLLRSGEYGATLLHRHSEPLTNLMYNVIDEFDATGKKGIVAYCNSALRIKVFRYEENRISPIIDTQPFDPAHLFAQIAQQSEARKRLIANFEAKFPEIFKKMKGVRVGENPFDVLALLLEAGSGFEGVSNRSLGFIGNGGLKLDMNLQSNTAFDYASLFASAMSYKIAGVEDGLIAFSIFESIVDLLSSILSDAKENLGTTETFLLGDMLSNQVYLSRIEQQLTYFEPKITKQFPVDTV